VEMSKFFRKEKRHSQRLEVVESSYVEWKSNCKHSISENRSYTSFMSKQKELEPSSACKEKVGK
jgi:hypothetical protein